MLLNGQRGFSFVELSIVLLVISIIVASVLQGIDLLRNTEVKTVVAQTDEYKAALDNFNAIYNGLPGDITNATSYWAATANGDGDEQIDAETNNEPFRALQQLFLAELFDVSVTGTWGSGFVLQAPGVVGNVPATKIDRAFIYVKCCSGTDYARTISYNNHVAVAAILGADITKRKGVFTPIEAFGIDNKIDDGIPDFGFVGGSGTYNSGYVATGCYSGTGNTSAYDTTSATYKDAKGCQMQFAYDWD